MSYLASLITLLGVWLNARKLIWCWPVWIVGNVVWVIAYIPRHDWAVVLLDLVMVAANVAGWRQWRKDEHR